MAESNVSGPWEVEDDITAGGDVNVTGNVVGMPALLFTPSTLTSTGMGALTSTVYGSTSIYAIVMTSTGRLVCLAPTTAYGFTASTVG